MIQLNLLRHQTQKFALSPTHKIENKTSKTTIQKNKRRTPETHTCQILSHKNALFYKKIIAIKSNFNNRTFKNDLHC